MNIAICDDSKVFLKTLERELNHYTALRDTSVNLRVFSNPNRLLAENLSDTQVAFLDIEMPQLNGLELAGQLRQHYPELLIVFLTSFIEYAPAGYRVNAFRYILKKELEQELPQVMDDIAAKLQADGSMIDLPTRDRTLEIAKKDVLYFKARPNVLSWLIPGWELHPSSAAENWRISISRILPVAFFACKKAILPTWIIF